MNEKKCKLCLSKFNLQNNQSNCLMLQSSTHFTVISDIHNTHRMLSIKKTDFLIICGDVTNGGNKSELKSFQRWLADQPTKHTVMIWGNHERRLELRDVSLKLESDQKNLTFLNGLKTIGNFQFYGQNYPFKAPLEKFDTTKPLISLSHEPPLGVMDLGISNRKIINDTFYHAGSQEVISFIQKYNPQMHCFGHCHSSHGICQVKNTLCVNGALVDDCGEPFKKPIEILYTQNTFRPIDQSKCITLQHFLKMASKDPFEYITTTNEYCN
ncbi:hypothetical protein EIN_060140 [Entamoeba invadens IP1]|uniref:hypothetical protein n=1 Tax=Entamoeba invadens IP1 TaxID=370355 RepID=UPI0002C3E295|nr:hypothetical protein EIN_060140 [Entamoeba invadens IP1]ELP93499.1 hypothetical protein EIN_060140 [Entamoeba invadens IP1]|eukprot:XP_004260270.1 hypothetical protein EIN_060140 [Entamoeba invadens IP1]